MTTELHPLRLAVGSHQPGSGKGCAENVVAWMMDPTNITDYPKCTAVPLAKIIQWRNDTICDQATIQGELLCTACTQEVLPLAFAAMGTQSDSQSLHYEFIRWCEQRSTIWRPWAADRLRAYLHYIASRGVAYDWKEWSKSPARVAANAASEVGDTDFTADAIAEWHRLAGTTPTQPPQAAVDHAARQMAVVR